MQIYKKRIERNFFFRKIINKKVKFSCFWQAKVLKGGHLESWMAVIAVTRNACGHHARVWNKRNAMQPAIPSNPTGRRITLPTDSMPLRCSSLRENFNFICHLSPSYRNQLIHN